MPFTTTMNSNNQDMFAATCWQKVYLEDKNQSNSTDVPWNEFNQDLSFLYTLDKDIGSTSNKAVERKYSDTFVATTIDPESPSSSIVTEDVILFNHPFRRYSSLELESETTSQFGLGYHPPPPMHPYQVQPTLTYFSLPASDTSFSPCQISWQQNTFSKDTLVSHASNTPICQATKKRCVEDVSPTIVPSFSEPIPISTDPWAPSSIYRKRTKSVRELNGFTACDSHGSNTHMLYPSYIPTQENDSIPYTSSPMVPTPPSIITATEEKQSYMLPNSHFVSDGMPRRQKLRYDGDYYTPKWVRYTGHLKEGYCDSCHPGKWLQLKNSAYWYHKQFCHGISSVSGKPFMKPLDQRMGKGDMIEGLCHQCRHYVPVCNGKKKNNYMLWYRHAHKCHLYEKPKVTPKKPSRRLSDDDASWLK
ncbi:uncharacterized protein B0P05DRAFT_321789 [Gilbertella persicaria]|uniref:uncharacterized protein n=1 Tax=Gilbertella persicaria TaxID=101096 RepID=UPI00222030F3|nr:uncharacterized protein B0P05DRAFT_321789 [Gilbertella persicaria]KAI8049818.1 hypothetical protein B0P05DRAFT_321789 [Gilbertella persicaria]